MRKVRTGHLYIRGRGFICILYVLQRQVSVDAFYMHNILIIYAHTIQYIQIPTYIPFVNVKNYFQSNHFMDKTFIFNTISGEEEHYIAALQLPYSIQCLPRGWVFIQLWCWFISL